MSLPLGARARRLGAVLGAATLALALGPAPVAHAAGPVSVVVEAVPSEVKAPTDGGGKLMFLGVRATNAVKAAIVIDSSQLSWGATVEPADKTGCTTAGAKTTCELPGGTYERLHFPVIVRSPAGAVARDAGSFSAYGIAEGFLQNFNVPTCRVAFADGPDLVAVDEIDQPAAAKPGDTVWVPVTFANEGNRTADRVVLKFLFSGGLEPDAYEGCTYEPYLLDTLVTCPTGESVEPGEEATFVTDDGTAGGHPGFAAKVRGDAYGEERGVFSVWPGADDLAKAAAGGIKSTTGKKSHTTVGKQSVQPEVNDFDNAADVVWNVDNFLDIQAQVAFVGPATGQAGDTIHVRFGVQNVGQASLRRANFFRTVWTFSFQAPDGTVVSGVPLATTCGGFDDPAGPPMDSETNAFRHFYTCSIEQDFLAGAQFQVDFDLRIDKVVPNAEAVVTMGSSRSTPPLVLKDDNAANDTAKALLNATTGGGTGSGVLPVTGAQTALLAGAGVVLLAGGVVLYRVARRRRVVLVTPRD